MTSKPNIETDYLSKILALDRRTAPFHPIKPRLQDQIKKERTGIKGESALTFPLKFLPGEDISIFHNPRLPDGNDYFEIDKLLLSKQYILMLEVKNWYGTLYFDGDRQVIRVGDDGREEGLPNPIIQVKLQRHRLQKWLRMYNFPHVPILYFVVISFPSTIIKPLFPQSTVPNEVIYSKSLPFHIHEQNHIYTNQVLDQRTFQQIFDRIQADHTPSKADVLKKFGISKNELIKGVFCPECAANPMKKEHNKWLCPQCHHASRSAHLQALHDYKLLIGDTITNQDAREFLRIDSSHVMKRILQKEGFPVSGKNRWQKYTLDFGDR